MKKQNLDGLEIYTIDVSKKVNWIKLFFYTFIAIISTLSLMTLYQVLLITSR